MGRCKLADIKYNNRKVGDTMKEKLEKMKKDVPAVFLAIGKKGDALVCKTVCGADGKCIPSSVWERCRTDSEDIWKDGKPKKRCYAVPIIIFWLIIIWLIVKAIFLK